MLLRTSQIYMNLFKEENRPFYLQYIIQKWMVFELDSIAI